MLHNNNNDVMNLSEKEQENINSIISFTMNTYTEILSKETPYYPANKVDFKKLKDKHQYEYCKYGINLILGGIMPYLLDTLMQYNYDIIINSIDNTNIDTYTSTQLECLIIKQVIKMLHTRDTQNLFFFLNQITSTEFNTDIYKKFFENNEK